MFHKRLLNDSLEFLLETFLHPSKNDASARRLKIGVTAFTIAALNGDFAGLYVSEPVAMSH